MSVFVNDNIEFIYSPSYATQVSSPINLISGEFYFMEAVVKVGSNSFDHLGVGVRQPDGKKHRPILDPDLYYEIPGETYRFVSYPFKLHLFVCLCYVYFELFP